MSRSIKEIIEEEEFTSIKDAHLHRALLASTRFQATLLGSMGLAVFFLLLGEWKNFNTIDWHLLGLLLPAYNLYNEWKVKTKAEHDFISFKERIDDSEI